MGKIFPMGCCMEINILVMSPSAHTSVTQKLSWALGFIEDTDTVVINSRSTTQCH